ncbi:MAG: ATP-binding cassette domain-containing protein [Solirubrobacteraceae bacterium]
MQPLLSFTNVSKRYPDGARTIVVFNQVSFDVEAGADVGILGARRSGKSTLLRLAAGLEQPDAGTVRFEGQDMASMSSIRRGRLFHEAIGLVSPDAWRPTPREPVVDYLVLTLVSYGFPLNAARYRARRALEEVEVPHCADELVNSLPVVERMRVMLARALIRQPRLLLVDEPAVIPSLTERDDFYTLVRALTRPNNLTLVVASEDAAAVHGTTVGISIGGGELNSTRRPATVLPFPERRQAITESRRP